MNLRPPRPTWLLVLVAILATPAWGNSVLTAIGGVSPIESGTRAFDGVDIHATVDYAVFLASDIAAVQPAGFESAPLAGPPLVGTPPANYLPLQYTWSTSYIYAYQIHVGPTSVPVSTLAVAFPILTPITQVGFYDPPGDPLTMLPSYFKIEQDAVKFGFVGYGNGNSVLGNGSGNLPDSSVLWFASPLSPNQFPCILWDHGTFTTGNLPSPFQFLSPSETPAVPFPPAAAVGLPLLAALGLARVARRRRCDL